MLAKNPGSGQRLLKSTVFNCWFLKSKQTNYCKLATQSHTSPEKKLATKKFVSPKKQQNQITA
jgi:hypothetical protein